MPRGATVCNSKGSDMFAFDLKDRGDGGKVTWVDETKITAAERAWAQGCQTMREAAVELVEQSNSKLAEFRGAVEGRMLLPSLQSSAF